MRRFGSSVWQGGGHVSQSATAVAVASGCSRWTLWPASGTTTSSASGSTIDQPSAEIGELRVVAPTSTSTGAPDLARRSHSGVWVPVPVARRLAAETRRGVAETIGAHRSGLGQAGEQRVGQPLVDEGRPRRRPRCGRRGARRRRVGPGVRRDRRYRPLRRSARVAGRPRVPPAPHGAPHARPSSSRRRRRPRQRPPVGRRSPRGRHRLVGGASPCPGRSTATHRAIGQPILERSLEGGPRPRGLREPVGEDDAEWSLVDGVAHHSCSATAWSAILRRTWANVSGSCAPGNAQRPLITYVGTAVMPLSLATSSSARTSSVPRPDARNS